MKKCFIRFGELNKRLLLPLLLALSYIILIVIDDLFIKKTNNLNNNILELCSIGIGKIAIIIIPYIKCFSISKEKNKRKCECNKKNLLYYFILFILDLGTNSVLFFGNNNNFDDYQSIFRIRIKILSTSEGLEIIYVTIIALFLLKYRYFIHHYLSIILFCLSSVSFDLILKKYSLMFGDSVIFGFKICLNIGIILVEGIYICYIKYLIDRQYYHYWNIIFISGIMLTIVNIIIILLIVIFTTEKSFHIVEIFWKYFRQVSTWIIITKFIIDIIFQFISNTIQILTIFYLSPEYVLISQNLSKIYNVISILVNKKDINQDYQYCYLIFYFLQIFSLLIYLEIFELNFCKLNKNTRRNIKSRIDDDLIDRIDSFNNSNFETKDGYIFKSLENELKSDDNLKIELKQINDDKDDNEGKD